MKRWLAGIYAAGLLGLGALPCLPGAELIIDLGDRAQIENRRPILIAHRGGVIRDGSPECSLAAIRLAAEAGYAMVELDIQQSRDGIPVLFHDPTLKEACGVDGGIKDYAAAELAKIRYTGSDQTIAGLEAALSLCRELNLGVMLDLKTGRDDRPFLRRIDRLIKTNRLDRATVSITGSPSARAELGHVMFTPTNEQMARFRQGGKVDLRGTFWFGLPDRLPSADVARLQECGALVFPAINTFRYPADRHREMAQTDIDRLVSAGVDGFQIDSIYADMIKGRQAPDPGAAARRADTKVTLLCLDAATGQPTPASICLTGDDGRVRLPPDGRVLDKPSLTGTFYRGLAHDPDPAWIGPVRKMQGRGDNNDRSYVYEERPSLPWWPEPVSHLVNGRTEIRLPAGRWHLAAERGPEHVPVRRTFETTGEGELAVTLELRRWIDLPAQGWWSGDVHVHHPTTQKTHRDFLTTYARGADVHVVNVLAMGHHRGVDFPQAGFGQSFRVNDGNYWLVSGQEDPRSNFGHIIGLNIHAMVRDLATYDFYDVTFDGIHRQPGALVGFAHFSWNGCDLPRGFPWYVTTEDLDFVELMQFGLVNSADYYDYLNLGFRLTAAAGSDIPWGSHLGEVRTYVHCGPDLTPDAWFEGLQEGRTFVSNGPALSFTVNGRLPGATLNLAASQEVVIEVRAESHPAIGELTSLMVVGPDGVVAETDRLEEGRRLVLRLDHAVRASQWLTAAARCGNGAQAHSSPVYVIVDGQPGWSATRAPDIIAEQLRSIALIEAEFKDRTDPRSKGLLQRLQKARAWYDQRLKKVRR